MNARTSRRHPRQIDTLGPAGQGRLGLTFCPGKYDPHAQTGAWDWDLETDLRALTEWGASTVVTLWRERVGQLSTGRVHRGPEKADPPDGWGNL